MPFDDNTQEAGLIPTKAMWDKMDPARMARMRELYQKILGIDPLNPTAGRFNPLNADRMYNTDETHRFLTPITESAKKIWKDKLKNTNTYNEYPVKATGQPWLTLNSPGDVPYSQTLEKSIGSRNLDRYMTEHLSDNDAGLPALLDKQMRRNGTDTLFFSGNKKPDYYQRGAQTPSQIIISPEQAKRLLGGVERPIKKPKRLLQE